MPGTKSFTTSTARAHQMGIYSPFVDLNSTKQLGGKTILFMVDGLFGTRDANDLIIREFAS